MRSVWYTTLLLFLEGHQEALDRGAPTVAAVGHEHAQRARGSNVQAIHVLGRRRVRYLAIVQVRVRRSIEAIEQHHAIRAAQRSNLGIGIARPLE